MPSPSGSRALHWKTVEDHSWHTFVIFANRVYWNSGNCSNERCTVCYKFMMKEDQKIVAATPRVDLVTAHSDPLGLGLPGDRLP